MDNWKSLYIYYISGTGNARISSEWIADEAGKRGLKTVVQQIDRLENIVIPGFPPGLCKEVFLLNTRAGMVLVATVLYRIMHYAMGFKPVKYLIRFTSLTALPFWRRYRFLKNNKNQISSVKQGTIT